MLPQDDALIQVIYAHVKPFSSLSPKESEFKKFLPVCCPKPPQCPGMQQLTAQVIPMATIFLLVAAHPMQTLPAVTEAITNTASNRPRY